MSDLKPEAERSCEAVEMLFISRLPRSFRLFSQSEILCRMMSRFAALQERLHDCMMICAWTHGRGQADCGCIATKKHIWISKIMAPG